MKKNTIKSTIIAAVAIFAGYNVYQSKLSSKELSDIVLANVEALADDESENESGVIYAWSNEIDCSGWWTGSYRVCQKNGPGNSCSDPGNTTCDCGRNC